MKTTNLMKTLKEHDKPTFVHSLRVGELCKVIGQMNNFNNNNINKLYKIGCLHDIGKNDIPKYILSKKTKLTLEEMNIIKKHPTYGFNKLRNLGYSKDICSAVVGHHEYSTNQYPRKEIRDDSVLTEIVAAADLVDALSNSRAYKKAFSLEEVTQLAHEQYTGNKKYLRQALSKVYK